MRVRGIGRFGLAGVVLSTAVMACNAAPAEAETDASDEALLQEIQLSLDESALDRSTEPCDDFFQFACGGYLKTVPIEFDEDFHDRAFDSMFDANAAVVDSIVADALAHPKTPVDQRLKDFYGSCLKAQRGPKDDPAQFAYLRAAGDRVNDIRTRQGLGAALAEIAVRSNSVPFFAVQAAADTLTDATRTSLFVGAPFRLETDETKLTKDVAEAYPDESSEARAARVRVIHGIAMALDATLPATDQGFHQIGRDGLARVMPHVDWDGFLAGLGIPHAQRIVVRHIDALEKSDAILASTSEDDLRVYFDYKARQSLTIALNKGRSVELDPSAGKFACDIDLELAVPGLVLNRFVEETVDPKAERTARAMTRAILKTFEKRLERNDFLDAATRVEAITKLRAILITPLRQKIDTFEGAGFVPDSYLHNWEAMRRHTLGQQFAHVDQRIDRTALEGGTDVNAFYAPDQNRIELQPGILHGAFFNVHAPRVLNFGALGWVIGHETTHGFDDSGRKCDAVGTRRDWWSPSVTATFEQKAGCFVEEYSAVEVPEAIDPKTHAPRHIDGALTLGENIADNGGIRVAYEAAEPYFQSSKPIAGFTAEQQFFLAGAQMWCGNMGPVMAADVLSDVHSPSKARVNVTMSNFDRFAKAFSCAPGKKMVAAQACTLW